MKLRLNSEYGTLKTVIMHRPGKEIDRLTPQNVKELLFEEMPFLENMQKEHHEFVSAIKDSGAEVLFLQKLLIDVLINDDLLIDTFRNFLKPVNLEELAEDLIAPFSTAECANILIAGIKTSELKKKFNHKKLDWFSDSQFIVPPSPNTYFTRDGAAITPAGVICSQMKFPARQREANLVRIIFENHELFKENFKPLEPNGFCIEGGDVIVISEKAVAIGNSERTDTEAIQAIAAQILQDGNVDRVYEVMLPKKRTFMHLDTVFTMIDENLMVTYPDAMNYVLETRVYRKEREDEQGKTQMSREVLNESLLQIMRKEIKYLEIIETGNGNPEYASREQWFDGANVFALGPRKVISYDRNTHTIRALRDAGVEVLTIPSGELYRGLGGPRCMTMAIDRQNFYYAKK
jgi:arginine deiminase